MSIVYEEIEKLFSQNSAREYLGEDVTLVEHMLQCATLALEDGASSQMIVAALLHDVGHLLIPDALEQQDSGIDAHHDEVGFDWLAQRFSDEVSIPVKLHVNAKRYLVTTNPEYEKLLSAASVITMRLQGGLMDEGELAEYESQEFADNGIQIRLWDDEGKVRGSEHLPLESFRDHIEICLQTK